MSDTLVGRVLDSTYRIVRPLARGGMGAIYVAEHARLAGKRYAVKMLHAAFAADENVFQRFRREAEIASQLGHEHIVEVHDFNTTSDRVAYMVMEYLDGEDLSARISRGAMRLGEIVRIVAQVASALGTAHAAGIVHRDLKPQNIFLCRRSGTDFVKVLDFGISKVRDSSSLITADQSVIGTPFYMSPEQAMGRVRDVDARTDVFALGAIIWEMLTGEMAFASDTIPGALYKVVHEEPRPVHELRSELPGVVTDVLARAMAKDREQRTASVQDLAAQLARAVTPSMSSIAIAATAMPVRATLSTMSSAVGQVAVTMPPTKRLPWFVLGGVLVAAAIVTAMIVGGGGGEASKSVTMPKPAVAPVAGPPPASLPTTPAPPSPAASPALESTIAIEPETKPASDPRVEAPAVVREKRRDRRPSKSRLPQPKPAHGTAVRIEPSPPPASSTPPTRFEPPQPTPPAPPPARKKSGTIFDQ